MIELSPNTAFMLYLGATLGLILGLWTYQHYRYKNKTILSSEQKLFICEYCHFAYLDNSEKRVTKCPQCQSFVK